MEKLTEKYSNIFCSVHYYLDFINSLFQKNFFMYVGYFEVYSRILKSLRYLNM